MEETKLPVEEVAAVAMEKAQEPKRKIITRDFINQVKDTTVEWADMSAWWGNGWGCWVHSMSGKAKGQFEADLGLAKGSDQKANWVKFRAAIIVACAKDSEDPDKAKFIFREQDVEALNEKNGAALDYLAGVCRRISGYDKKDVDEMTKN